MSAFTCESVARAVLGEPMRREGAELLYRCPRTERHANGDAHPSLKVNPKKDTWACFVCGASGTAWQLAAFFARLDPGDKSAISTWLRERGLMHGRQPRASHAKREPIAIYEYRDAYGNLVARKLRFEPGTNGRPKSFVWERWENGAWVDGLVGVKVPLYRFPEIVAERFVISTEGEKDADAGAKIGLPTTTSGGTDSFRDDHAEALRGKDVCIVSDADPPGRAEAQKRAAMLYGRATTVRIVEFSNAKDLADWIAHGGTRDQFLSLCRFTPEWRPAAGAEILDAVFRYVRRFVALSHSQALAVVLWIAHTHAFEAASCTPYLSINSAEKESGKTRLLEVLRLFVFKPWLTGRVSAAVLARKIDAERPTLLLDESDAAFGGEREYAETLRGILNTGYQCDGASSCCVGQGANISYKDFSTFCPKAIAGIGKLPDTVASRSILLRLKRAPRGSVERFRKREAEREASEIAAKLGAWCASNLEMLRVAHPEIPNLLSDRQADCCEPLLSIADWVGGEWPEESRKALVELCTQAQASDDSIGVKLLRDIKGILQPHDDDGESMPAVDRIASCDLVKSLGEMEDRPWAEWGKSQKPITQPQLARVLDRYDIDPKPLRLLDGRRLKGYEREQFAEAWGLYLPPDSPSPSSAPDPKRDTVTTFENTAGNGDSLSVTPAPCHASVDAKKTNENERCHVVTVSEGPTAARHIIEGDL